MAQLENLLLLERCPYCQIDNPHLITVFSNQTNNSSKRHVRYWKGYVCNRCGGIVIASSERENGFVNEIYPSPQQVDEFLPPKAKEFLKQAINSVHAPAGSIMLCASSVDAMLKEKNYKEGSLYSRIDKAATDHLITKSMAEWAHQVRLDANDQRHNDEESDLPNEDDARKCIDFTSALGLFMYTLPSRVERGIKEAKDEKSTQ